MPLTISTETGPPGGVNKTAISNASTFATHPLEAGRLSQIKRDSVPVDIPLSRLAPVDQKP